MHTDYMIQVKIVKIQFKYGYVMSTRAHPAVLHILNSKAIKCFHCDIALQK